MTNKKLWLVLSLPFIILIILSLVVFGFYSTSVFEKFTLSEAEKNLRSNALVIRSELVSHGMITPSKIDTSGIQKTIIGIDNYTNSRITVIMPDGRVVGDSRENHKMMDNHLDRPEVREALDKGEGYFTRYSHTIRANLMYYAVTVKEDNKTIAILRTAVSLEEIEKVLRKKYLEISIGGLIILAAASLLGFYFSRRLSEPIQQMRQTAEKFSAGNFEHKIYPPKIAELQSLAESLNSMAAQLDEKVRSLTEQTKLRQAVLESMKEGVVAVDLSQRILLINKTAEQILRLTKSEPVGKSLQEIVRLPDVQQFFLKILREGSSDESEVTIKEDVDRILQLRGTPLFDSENNRIGVLVVINDVTELRHFDNLKRDFVANVSHELKTPITTIKGFIETLKEGAVNEPVNAGKFLDIVSKHADRLNLIIEDLLSLSRLEQKSTVKEIKFLNENIKPILESVIEDFALKTRDKNIIVTLECDGKLAGDVNHPLIEEAVGNLLDNAIKYSEYGKKVFIKALSQNGKLVISVSDEGPGIAHEHQPRIFERFYRVDKARSREAGGTGLGLAIVKHIAQVHRGTVSVESQLGKGSTFTISIPGSQAISSSRKEDKGDS